ASATSSGRIDASARPTVAQYTTTPNSERASATSATVLKGPVAGGRKASATAIRIAASPALNRKNFTPASRDTRTSVKAIPTPRCARKRKRTEDRDIRGRAGRVSLVGQVGGRVDVTSLATYNTYLTYPTNLTSAKACV